MPTPRDFCDNTGYSFSAVTLGSNPLYNWKTWSVSTATTNREKDLSSLNTSEEWSDRDGGGRGAGGGARQGVMDRRGFEESETVLDFRVLSIDSGSDRKARHRPSWLPGIQKQENSSHQGEGDRGVALELSVALSNISGSHTENES